MSIRRLRPPRAGEILSWLSSRRLAVKTEEWKTGPQLRIDPAPCCKKQYKGGGAVVMSPKSGLWKCFACGTKGNFFWFAKLWGDPIADAYEDARPVNTAAYDRIRKAVRRLVSGGHYPDLLAYCRQRGFVDATLDAWRVTTCGERALRFPLMALEAGRFAIANARVRRVFDSPEEVEKKIPRDWFEAKGGSTCLALGNHLLGVGPRLWAAETPPWSTNWVDPIRDTPENRTRLGSPFPSVRRVLVVEGQWDAMTAWQLGIPNVLSLPNGASAVDVAGLMRYVPEDAEVWLAVDMDEAGDRAAESFFAQLDPTKVARLVLPEKDLNDWFRKDPTLTAEKVLATARGLGIDAVEEVKPKSRWISLSEKPKEVKSGAVLMETPWPALTKRLGGGFRAGHVSGILAPSGSGKTTIANQIVAHAAKLFVKSGVIQLEQTREEVHRNLRNQVLGWTEYDEDDIDQSNPFEQIMLSGLEGKVVTLDQTLVELRKMAEDGARLLVMDNWDFVVPDGLRGEALKTTAHAMFQELCKEFGAHGIAVWQPSKVDRDAKVNSGSQKGMSRIFQDADCYMNLNRFGNARRIQVEKARVPGVEADEATSMVWLRYNVARFSLFETESQASLSPIDGPPVVTP